MGAVPVRIDKGSAQVLGKVQALGSGKVLKCYQCGTCVGECPAIISDLHVRRLMKFCIYGLEEQLLYEEGVWGCTTCHLCSERCPEGASPFELVMAIRRMQSQDGRLPDALRDIVATILRTGHSVDLEDKHKKARKAVGLSELPPTILKHPDMLEEVRAIVETRGIGAFISRVGEG